jgi:glycosyltransferase involved in cell wall biosynthesis
VNSPRVIYAPNVHQGGGRTLLLPLLNALKDDNDVWFILDRRMHLPDAIQLQGRVSKVQPTVFSRLAFEWKLKSLLPSDARLLGFGNLPPLFAHQGEQTVFVQNKYLIDPAPPLKHMSLPVRLRLAFERWWLRTRGQYIQHFVVQTPTMRKTLLQSFDAPVEVLPFMAEPAAPMNAEGARVIKRYDFLYVATGESHKGHRPLIEAWILLAERASFPTLALTLSRRRFPGLCAWVQEQSRRHGLKVSLLDECAHTDMPDLYAATRALIYPSVYESFGLPLLEAAMAGLPVIAADIDYVWDVINPTAVFDPYSAESIAESVMDFSYKPATLKISPLSANDFLRLALNREKAG